ncbi:MAG: Oligopeptide-binding protein AppA precursor [Candidatus Heimdallarchaeota archaeon LC_2]|nr:MAG: Oligopeptide-binding protein AppA precursor [Candidatus Heimdallarchaeota archaeon LC_2]
MGGYKLRLSLVIILLLVSSIFIFEFNGSKGQPSVNHVTQKVIVWGYNNPFGSENSPTDVFSVYGYDYMNSIYNGLMRRTVASDRAFVPNLASTMPTVSVDFKTWTFTLRPGLKFSDGSDLNASSIVFSYRVHLTASIDNAYSLLSQYFTNSSIVEVDNLTVQFNMLKAFAFAPQLFSQWIYSEDHFGPLYDACLADITLAACNWNTDLTGVNLQGGSGPFKVNVYDTLNNFIELAPNPFYYNALAINIETLVFRTIVDATAAQAAFAAGEIQIFDANYKAKATDFSSLVDITETFVGAPGTQEMSINHNHKYFGLGSYITTGANARTDFSASANATAARNIRKAISHTIDRDFIANEISGGLASPASTIMPSISIGWDATLVPRVYDLNVAKTFMEDAGFDYSGKTYDPVTGAMFAPFFEITVLSPIGNVDREQWAARMGIELPKIGIGVKEHVSDSFGVWGPRTVSHPVPPPNYDNGGYDVFFIGYSFELDFDITGLYEKSNWRPSGGNFYNYDNSTLETALSDYVTELDIPTRISLIKRLQEILYDDQPTIPIVYGIDHWAWNNYIVGLDGLSLSQRDFEWELVDIIGDFVTITKTVKITDQITETSFVTTTNSVTTIDTVRETTIETETQTNVANTSFNVFGIFLGMLFIIRISRFSRSKKMNI